MLGLLVLVFLFPGEVRAESSYWKNYFSIEERKAVQKNAEKYTISQIESKSNKWKGIIRGYNIKNGSISDDDIEEDGITTNKIRGLGDYINEKISDSSTPQDFSADNLTGTYAALDGSQITGITANQVNAIPYSGATSNVDLGLRAIATTGTGNFGNIKTPIIFPSADSTSAFQINKADGITNVLNVDTTNGRVGIGTTSPIGIFEIQGSNILFRIKAGVGSPNIIAGYSGNTIADGSAVRANIIAGGGYVDFINHIDGDETRYATISGGYDNYIDGITSTDDIDGAASTIGGGAHHIIKTTHGTIAGGSYNTLDVASTYGSIGGGTGNTIQKSYGTIAGGRSNTITSTGQQASVGGGYNNSAGGNNATIPGGLNNVASGAGSFAAGRFAQATADGSFALADYTGTGITNNISNSFSGYFSGGWKLIGGNVGIGTIDPKTKLEVDGIIKTKERSSATCNADAKGGIYFDSDDNHFYGCNGTAWVQLDN